MAGMDSDGMARSPDGDAPGRAPLRIFVNYRHEDMPFAASALYRELKGRFSAENIFFDAGTLRPGMQFLREIRSHLSGAAGAFLALIGPKWLSAMDAHRRRGDDDYVASEIELGLRNGWAVIPVLLNDATLPDPRDLALALKELPRYQVAQLRQTSLDAGVPGSEGALRRRHLHGSWHRARRPVRAREMGRRGPAARPGTERVRRVPHRRRRQPADQDGHRQDQRRDRRPRHRLPVEEQLRDHRRSLQIGRA